MSETSFVYVPLIILGSSAFGLFLFAKVFRLSNKVVSILSAIVFLVVLTDSLFNWFQRAQNNLDLTVQIAENGAVVYRYSMSNGFVLMTTMLICILITIYSGEFLKEDDRFIYFYPLLMLSISGLMGMLESDDLFSFVLFSELSTLAASSMIAFRFEQDESVRAGFKYLIMNSIAMMMMLLGVYFAFQSGGQTGMKFYSGTPTLLSRIASGCFLLGFCLKAGVVPLHTWMPDVYGKAPSIVGSLLAGVVSKSALFIYPRVCLELGMNTVELGAFLMIFSFPNMVLGSVRTLKQKHLKRFLSYSAISQTGYLMFVLGIGFYYAIEEAIFFGLFLFLVIAIMKSLAFLSTGLFEKLLKTDVIDSLRGISNHIPIGAFSLSVSLAGLAGIPLLGGFIGKWFVFSAVLEANDGFALFGLFVFIISSLIGLGGYLPLLFNQYRKDEITESNVKITSFFASLSIWITLPLVLLTGMVIALGLAPGPFLSLIRSMSLGI